MQQTLFSTFPQNKYFVIWSTKETTQEKHQAFVTNVLRKIKYLDLIISKQEDKYLKTTIWLAEVPLQFNWDTLFN